MKTADKTRETPAFPKTFIMAMIFGVGLNPVNSTLISTALAPISHDLRIDAGRATPADICAVPDMCHRAADGGQAF